MISSPNKNMVSSTSKWEWKVAPAANSGVKYFIMEERGGAIGHEYQVIDDNKHPDALRGPKWQTAAFYDVFPATNRVLQQVGSFNESRVKVKSQQAEHWLKRYHGTPTTH